MSKLLEIYSKATGLKIGKQDLNESFYPLPFEKYITFHCGSGMQAKNYPYWNEVIFLIKKILEENGISIVILGRDPDFQIQGCHNLVNQTNISQTNYILRNSLLHCCNDTWTAHRAGYLGIPLVEIFGSTSIANHSPHTYNKDKTIFIESHRFNRNPSFQSQEQPQTIALISPESIANAIFKNLGLDNKTNIESLYFGPLYQQTLIELVPNCVLPPQFQMPNPLIVRMDYEFNEKYLTDNLSIRKCIIITNKAIDLNILFQLQKNIVLIRIEVDNVDKFWIKSVEKIGIKIQCYTMENDVDKIRKKRLELLSTCYYEQVFYPDKNNARLNAEIYLNKKLEEGFDIGKVKFKTNKFIFANDKFFLSKAHWKSNQNTEDVNSNYGNVIDSEDFWLDQNYFYFYN
jgi:hypothetical protein